MKKIRVKADIFIIITRDIPTHELTLRTEMALNSMGPLTVGDGLMFMAEDKVALRFHFYDKPEVLIGEE